MNGHEAELDLAELDSWQDQANYLAKKYCQDENDRKLINVETYDCVNCDGMGNRMWAQGEYGDYVSVDAFRSLAERFLLAMELIHEMEKDDAK
jgi:hypothetical protein